MVFINDHLILFDKMTFPTKQYDIPQGQHLLGSILDVKTSESQ